METIEVLTERNARFADGEFTAGMGILPQFRTIVVGCVDPRVDPAHIFGVQLGEVAVIRNVGGRITPTVLAEIALLATLTKNLIGVPVPPELIVLQHTDCGILHLQEPPDPLAAYFEVDVASMADKHVGDPRAAIEVDVSALRESPLIPGGVRVTGMLYDVETGRVEVISGPDVLPAA